MAWDGGLEIHLSYKLVAIIWSELDWWCHVLPFGRINIMLLQAVLIIVCLCMSVCASATLQVWMKKSGDMTPRQFLDHAGWQLSPAPGCGGAINMSTPNPSLPNVHWLCLTSRVSVSFSQSLYLKPNLFKVFKVFFSLYAPHRWLNRHN